MTSAASKYKRKLSKHLKCCGKAKKALIASFDQKLTGYLEENPASSEEMLSAAFGSPAEMAAILMEQVTPKEAKQYRVRSIVKKVLVGVLILLFVLLTIHVYCFKSIPVYTTDKGGDLGTEYVYDGQ